MNEITYGNDESFSTAIKEVDRKLLELIKEFYVGVDGGDKSLLQLVNAVFEDAMKAESLAKEIETEADGAAKNVDAIKTNQENTQEIIRELQDKISRLLNATEVEGPEALQDAFDRSEKFNNNSSELKDILDQVKRILKDYEGNLLNAKRLTALAIEKFAKVSQQADDTLEEQKAIEDELRGIDEMKLSEDELKNMKKLAREALEEANKVYDEAFDLLNEVSEFQLVDKLGDINKKLEELVAHSDEIELGVEQFNKDNEKFFIEMEATVDAAQIAEEKAFKLQDDIEDLLKTINDIHSDALKAIADKNSVIENARIIYNGLQDFTLKVEKSREGARMALEKIPEILKTINESVAVVDKLEKQVEDKLNSAIDSKKLCVTAKEQMDEILKESEDIKAKFGQLKKDFENLPGERDDVNKFSNKLSDDVDKLEKNEVDDSKLIETSKEKIERTKSQAQKSDVAVDDVLRKIEGLMDDISKLKSIDEAALDDFGMKMNFLTLH